MHSDLNTDLSITADRISKVAFKVIVLQKVYFALMITMKLISAGFWWIVMVCDSSTKLHFFLNMFHSCLQ